MTRIEAIYQDGVFKPLSPTGFAENQYVCLNVEPVGEKNAQNWFSELEECHREIVSTQGFFPDSTPEIAADRTR